MITETAEPKVIVASSSIYRIIRQARVSDLSRLLALGEMFYEEAKLPGKFNPESFVSSWTMFLTQNIGVIFLLEEGNLILAGIGGVRFPDSSSGRVQAQELFWFVHPDHRRSGAGETLLSEFEAWSIDMQCHSTIVALMEGISGGVQEVYLRRGYRPLETWYIKENLRADSF